MAPNSGGLRTGTITIASLTFTVTQAEFIALPDLTVVSVNAPVAAAPGGRISAAATVRNQGAARSGTFRVGFYFGDVFGGSCNMAALDAGAQAACTADVAAPPQPGAYFLRAVADDQGAVPESDETNNAFSPGQVTVTAPELPRPAAVVNAATFELGPVAPGEVVTLFGSGIGPPAAQSGLATLLGETRVWFDGTPAPLLYAQAGQVSAIVPFGVAGKPSTAVMVEYRGVRSAPMNIPVVQAAPALFSAFAQVGDIVVLYGTGAGAMDPPLADGQVPAGAVSKPVLPVAVRIGGVDAEVLYAGQAPGIVAGVIQINVRVPAGMSGPVPVQLIVGGTAGPPVNLSLL